MVKRAFPLGFSVVLFGLPAFAQDRKDEPVRMQPAVFVVPSPSVAVIGPTAAPRPANRPSDQKTPVALAAAATPAPNGPAFSLEVGGGISLAYQSEQVVYSAKHLELAGFLGWSLRRVGSGSIDVGYRSHVSVNGTEVIHRHQAALTLWSGLAICGLGAGLAAAHEWGIPGTLFGFSFEGLVGVRLGNSGLYLGVPLGADLYRRLPAVRTIGITLGYESL